MLSTKDSNESTSDARRLALLGSLDHWCTERNFVAGPAFLRTLAACVFSHLCVCMITCPVCPTAGPCVGPLFLGQVEHLALSEMLSNYRDLAGEPLVSGSVQCAKQCCLRLKLYPPPPPPEKKKKTKEKAPSSGELAYSVPPSLRTKAATLCKSRLHMKPSTLLGE